MNGNKNLIAVARWMIRYEDSKPVPEGYRRDLEPNKFVFINGRVFEYPRHNVDKQIFIENVVLGLNVTLEQLLNAGKAICIRVMESPETVKEKTTYIR